MPETPAAVHSPKGSIKDVRRAILQQFEPSKLKEPQEWKSSQDLLHSSIVAMAVTGSVSRRFQVLQNLQNQQFRAVPAVPGLPSS